MSIRFKIVGAPKREKSGLISFATCWSFYAKQFRSFWCGARFCAFQQGWKPLNIILVFRIIERGTSRITYVFLILLFFPKSS
jgi:hypothetical protein